MSFWTVGDNCLEYHDIMTWAKCVVKYCSLYLKS